MKKIALFKIKIEIIYATIFFSTTLNIPIDLHKYRYI